QDIGIEPTDKFKLGLAAYEASYKSATKAVVQLETSSDLARQAAAINESISALEAERDRKLKSLEADLRKVDRQDKSANLTAVKAYFRTLGEIENQMEERYRPLLERNKALRASPENRKQLAVYDSVYSASEMLRSQIEYFKENPKALTEIADDPGEAEQ
ncbi:MAG: hypothetical protein ACXWKG_14095, partial [Limisphaerales bacterium]